jgi:diguanylate cyclase (GGDEF)-like protein
VPSAHLRREDALPQRSGLPVDDGSRLASYQTLLRVSRMLLGSASLEELFDRITHELKTLVPYDVLTIYQVDGVRRLLVPLHSVDLYAAEIMDAPLELGQGLTGWVVEHRRPQNVPNAHLDPRIQIVPGTGEDPEAIALVPLLVRDEPIGALNVYRLGHDAYFSDDEFELICHFADLAALALDNTRIREQLMQEAQTDWLTGLFNHRVFQERVREEVERAHRYRRRLSVVSFDLDDFKMLNDVHGHQEGDLVLRRVAGAAAGMLRAADAAFRVGGEELAILMPETGKQDAMAVAERLCAEVRALPGPRPITISCGVATFPEDAKNPTELLAAADAALYAAKDRGKDQAAGYSLAVRDQRSQAAAAGRQFELESLAQIKLLGTLAGKLNRLNDVWQIAETIVTQLRTMIDYHNARVYLLGDDGRTLEPVAFGGTISEYAGETFDALRCEMGEGITGTAAERGQTLNIPDAQHCEFAEDIEGSADIEESILAVPLRYERRTIGVIVLSKLGLDQFSVLAVRLLELLAAQAAVAFENARLLEAERRSAAVSQALLGIATMAATDPSMTVVAQHLVRTARELTGSTAAALVTAQGERPRILAAAGDEAVRSIALAVAHAGHPATEQLQVIDVDSLAARTADASPLLAKAAVVPVDDAVLVVVCDSFSDRIQGVLSAVAGQGGLALRSAELLAGRRVAS